MSREAVLERVRGALGRKKGQAPGGPAPTPLLRRGQYSTEEKIEGFIRSFDSLAGKVVRAADATAAREAIDTVVAGRAFVTSRASVLKSCGFELPEYADKAQYRQACADAHVSITGADYALAETGTVVLLASPEEGRIASLLPPVHIAVIPVQCMLINLDELLTILPRPAEQTSSMVLITGPSRTADIEQILVRGVHGPGEVWAVLLERLPG